jgi:hypothetical protein
MGTMLSTKGTGLAVPKMPDHETALAAEVRTALPEQIISFSAASKQYRSADKN